MSDSETIIKSLKAVLYERLTSVLTGTFIISWIVFNWKIIIYMFFIGDSNIARPIYSVKIEEITNYLNNKENLKFLLYYPVITTTLYAVVFPFLSAISNLPAEAAIWIRNKIRYWFNKYKYLTFEESLRYIEQAEELKKGHAKLFQESKAETEQLKRSIDQKDKNLSSLQEQINDLTSKSNELKQKLETSENNLSKEKKNKRNIEQNLLREKDHKIITLEENIKNLTQELNCAQVRMYVDSYIETISNSKDQFIRAFKILESLNTFGVDEVRRIATGSELSILAENGLLTIVDLHNFNITPKGMVFLALNYFKKDSKLS